MVYGEDSKNDSPSMEEKFRERLERNQYDINRRVEVLRKKAKAENLNISHDVILCLALQMDIATEKLEKALVRVLAYSSLKNRDMDVELAIEALENTRFIRQTKSHFVSRVSRNGLRVLSRSAILTALSGILMLNGCSPFTETLVKVENTQAQAKQVQVNIAQDLVLSGITEPYQQVMISPSVSGNVKSIYVDLGSYVKKGQKLAEMFEGDLAYRIHQAEAQVRTIEVEAQVKKVEQQIQLNQIQTDLLKDNSEDLEETKYEIADAKVALTDAQNNLERMKRLHEQGAVSQKDLEDALKLKEQAEINLNKLQQLLSIRNQKASSEKETTAIVAKLKQESILTADKLAKMGVEQAKADLELIRYQYNNLTVEAPINGHITEKNAIVGAPFSPQKPMFIITNLDKLYVKVDVPEAVITRMKLGQAAKVTIPTLGKTVEGKVTYIAQMADTENNKFPVKILIDNVNYEIKGGMTAQIIMSE